MNERFTDRTRKIFRFAEQKARQYHQTGIGVDVIVLGIIQEGTSAGYILLEQMKVDFAQLTSKIEELLAEEPERALPATLALKPGAVQVIAEAEQYADSMSHIYIGSEHIVYGILKSRAGIVFDLLRQQGVDPEQFDRLYKGLSSPDG